ncbi:nuclear transport factor 2 family protein [Streptomyces sp. NPDC088354]|uniref:nuclear transport factor 2 family protein n=1 Tax=unclassified Streptomyces TaxID=2593676 RepID=UPI0029B76B4C|nr:nuclear transport factor 2 family protein [Streptomyces sp. MI02-7b]MDX3073779.1 nuclear transport factor 2 family protein [Streptomyces sp. MI02-7b]
MTTTDAAAAVREHLRAFNARDLEALLAGFTDDVVWITGGTTVRGRAALTGFFDEAMRGLLPTLELRDVIAEGARAACQMTETLTYGGEVRSYPIAAFYELRDGRIASAKVYREGSADVA